MGNIDFTRAIGATFPFQRPCNFWLGVSRTRLANRKIKRTTKETGTSSQPGIEPSLPALASNNQLFEATWSYT
jgi:hypothetical protein